MVLSQRLGLQQVLTPQMQQSLALLQAPVMELRALVQQELARNPVLEEAPATEGTDEGDAGDGGLDDATRAAIDPSEPPADTMVDPARERPSSAPVDDLDAALQRLVQMDEEWRSSVGAGEPALQQSEVAEEKHQHLFDSLTTAPTLADELAGQLHLLGLTPEARAAAEALIGNLNGDGYLLRTPEEVAQAAGAPATDFEAALKVVQGLDPAGIGARDLRECLLLQLERRGQGQSLEAQVVRDHLEALGRHKFAEIGRALGVYPDEIQDAAENVGKLDPHPGRRFAPADDIYVVPEVFITRSEDGEYQITTNRDHLPRLRISHAYKDLLAQASSSPEVREYLRERIRDGKFLLKSLGLRERTIESISREIVRRQRDYFDLGRSHLKPMTMAQVAEVVGVHETTVSRAVSGKFMDTPLGLLEMRALFSSGVGTADGDGMAAASVKEFIAELVKAEDAAKPLSDDELGRRLGEKGIKIARRTVAKYRGEMNILPVNLRKRL
ncbi:MAG: RNA polymerase factor sigma-54 [Limisphaerales bacterium]